MSTVTDIKEAHKNGELTHNQIVRILIGLLLGMFLAALDQTIVSTAIRTIGDDLHGLSMQAWVTTAYLITSTIATPIYGKLGDIYGRKKLFLFAISIFILGSLACSFADTMTQLSIFRAIQGIGAGGLFSLAIAIIGDIVPPRERAKYTGYFMAVFATSSVLGPVIGGFFAEQSHIFGLTGWRWVFLVNVPIGILALGVVSKTLHLHHVKQQARIDWFGALALVIALTPLLTVAEQGRTWGWGSTKSITCFIIGAIGTALFIFIEHFMKDDALIPFKIFKNKATTITILASIIVGIGMFGGMMVLPLYMQIVHATSPMKSGLMMLPMVAGMMTAAMGSGIITSKTGRIREFPIVGTFLAAVGLFLLSTIDADTALWLVMIYMFILGFGLGNCMQPLTIIVQNSVPPQEIGVATSAATFFRQTGGTLGVSIFLSMLFSTVGDNIKDSLTKALPGIKQAVHNDPSLMQNPYNAGILKGDKSAMSKVQDDSSIINKMSDIISHPFKAGFAESMSRVFLLASIIMICAFLVTLLMPKIALRDKPNSELKAEEENNNSDNANTNTATATNSEGNVSDDNVSADDNNNVTNEKLENNA